MHGNYKNDHFLVENSKPLHKYWPAALGTVFSTKFLLDAQIQDSGVWNIANAISQYTNFLRS